MIQVTHEGCVDCSSGGGKGETSPDSGSTLKIESIEFLNKNQFSPHHQDVNIYCQQVITKKGKEREREGAIY